MTAGQEFTAAFRAEHHQVRDPLPAPARAFGARDRRG